MGGNMSIAFRILPHPFRFKIVLVLTMLLFFVSLFSLLSPFSPLILAHASTQAGRITIKTNQDFLSCGCVSSGTGTKTDPFIISGLTLVSKSGPGILVDNSGGGISDYFVITGDTITGGNGPPTSYPGIEFIDLNGLGEITGSSNTISGNEYGIYLLNSQNILIDGGSMSNGATVNNNGIAGIAIVGGGHNTIQNIQVNKNGVGIPEDFFSGGRGIELNSTSYNTISNVTLSEDSQAGLALFSSSYNTIQGIVTHYPDFYATIIDGGSGNVLKNDVFQTADYVGLWIRDGSSSNLVTNSQILANGPIGNEIKAGIVPYFTVGLYLSSGASNNQFKYNYFNNGNTGGSIIVDNGVIVNAVQSPVQSNNPFNDPSTGNEPSTPIFPSGPAGGGNTFCGNSIYTTQGPVNNSPTC